MLELRTKLLIFCSYLQVKEVNGQQFWVEKQLSYPFFAVAEHNPGVWHIAGTQNLLN